MTWETRTHWLWGLLRPCRGWLALALLGLGLILFIVIGFLPIALWTIIPSAFFLMMALFGFSTIWAKWNNFALVVTPGERIMRERRGVIMISERCFNLGMTGSKLYRQTFLGRLLDYGNLSINAFGGPYVWENLGQFRTLRRIIESQGEWTPRPRIVLRVALGERFNLLWLSLRRSWERLLRWWRRRPRRIPASSLYRLEFSAYERFLRFAGNFLFPKNVWHFDAMSNLSGSAGTGPTSAEGQMFWHILKIRRILIADKRGRPCRHSRIRSMQDLQRRIPAEWFVRYIRQYQV